MYARSTRPGERRSEIWLGCGTRVVIQTWHESPDSPVGINVEGIRFDLTLAPEEGAEWRVNVTPPAGAPPAFKDEMRPLVGGRFVVLQSHGLLTLHFEESNGHQLLLRDIGPAPVIPAAVNHVIGNDDGGSVNRAA